MDFLTTLVTGKVVWTAIVCSHGPAFIMIAANVQDSAFGLLDSSCSLSFAELVDAAMQTLQKICGN